MLDNIANFILFIILLFVVIVIIVTICRETIIFLLRYFKHLKNQTTDFINNAYTSIEDLVTDHEWLEDKKEFKIDTSSKKETEFFVESFNKVKGEELEEKIIEILESISNDIFIIKNSFVPRNNNKTKKYEVDILAIHKSGVYVIESKNYAGMLYGTEKKLVWKCYYTDGRFYTTTNPIIMNQRKIDTLVKFFNNKIPRKLFKSYVVFGDKGKFKVKTVNKSTKMLLVNDLKKTIKNDIKNEELTNKQMNYIYEKLTGEK